MKLSVPSFFVSSKKKKSRSISRSATPSFASCSSSDDSISPHLRSTPDSVLPKSAAPAEVKILRRELEAVLRRIGNDPPTEEEVAAMMAEAEADFAGGAAAEEDELLEAFAVFDANGDGKISAEELLKVFVALGDEDCSLEDCRRMIGEVDGDGDGFVGFEDFARMMDSQRC